MIRAAVAADAPALEAFLARHPETSMFLRQNLAAHGPEGGTHAHAARFWGLEDGGNLAGVVALTRQGMLLMQLPGLEALAAVRQALAGERITGMNGEAGQVARVRAALGLADEPCSLDRTEPLYRMALADLRLPEAGNLHLRAATPADAGLLTGWRADYLVETLGAVQGPHTEMDAAAQVSALTAQDRLRVLEQAGTPVAMTSFNAVLPGIVQIGGVFTLPARRGRGHARDAVALHLAEARAAGAREAILFASGPPAMRAYEGIGFQRIGGYQLVFFTEPAEVPAP